MAGDWITVEDTTPDKPEVYRMAALLSMPPEQVVGHLVRIWVWADQQSLDGNAISVTEMTLDHIAQVTGFSKAMREVGWLNGSNGSMSLPNFDRHNGKTAKSRALTRKRVQRFRNDASVTLPLPEKRREEKKEKRVPLPPFEPSKATREWAELKGYTVTWDAHVEYFRNYVANRSKPYKNLEEAFRNCLIGDYGNLRKAAGARTVHGAVQSAPPCAHCAKPITSGYTKMAIGKVCDACRHDYMDGKWK